MQVDQFIHFLSQPEELAEVSEKNMLAILREFPYCQTGQLMATIRLHLNNSILFEEQLKKTASISPDRKKLFTYIEQRKNKQVEEPSNEIPIVKQQISTTLLKEKVGNEIVAEETNAKNQLEDVPTKTNEESLDLLEKEYLTSAISSSILLDSDKVNLEEKETDKPFNDEKIAQFDADAPHTYSAWLSYFNGDSKKEKTDSLSNKELGNDAIINRFIQEDPRIKPKKTTFYNPSNMARMSVTDSGIVSETLALIHVEQGSFQEAIDVYEKLILKNPKKRSYFANQIKNLKQKLK
jgi:hypothetical protein